jgi:hypothetical protein
MITSDEAFNAFTAEELTVLQDYGANEVSVSYFQTELGRTRSRTNIGLYRWNENREMVNVVGVTRIGKSQLSNIDDRTRMINIITCRLAECDDPQPAIPADRAQRMIDDVVNLVGGTALVTVNLLPVNGGS